MSLREILQRQSIWTWNIMQRSAQLGEMIREDAITSVNLAEIMAAAKHESLELTIFSNQGAHLEQETGADWQWVALGKYWLVQAKRLDVVPGRGVISYTIVIPQMWKLIDYAVYLNSLGAGYIPAYVFYNSMIQDSDPANVGCIFVQAADLANYIFNQKKPRADQKEITLSPKDVAAAGAKSWFNMFPDNVVID
jgi:hypothetical protein